MFLKYATIPSRSAAFRAVLRVQLLADLDVKVPPEDEWGRYAAGISIQVRYVVAVLPRTCRIVGPVTDTVRIIVGCVRVRRVRIRGRPVGYGGCHISGVCSIHVDGRTGLAPSPEDLLAQVSSDYQTWVSRIRGTVIHADDTECLVCGQ